MQHPTGAGLRNEFGESALGNWQADVMREFAKADVAFQNNGGIRKDLPAGQFPGCRRVRMRSRGHCQSAGEPGQFGLSAGEAVAADSVRRKRPGIPQDRDRGRQFGWVGAWRAGQWIFGLSRVRRTGRVHSSSST